MRRFRAPRSRRGALEDRVQPASRVNTKPRDLSRLGSGLEGIRRPTLVSEEPTLSVSRRRLSSIGVNSGGMKSAWASGL